jgi:hypothetical protein
MASMVFNVKISLAFTLCLMSEGWAAGSLFLSFFIFFFFFYFFLFEAEGQQASAKAHEEVDHLASFPLSREEISLSRIKLPTSSS